MDEKELREYACYGLKAIPKKADPYAEEEKDGTESD